MTLHLTQFVKQRTIEREISGLLSINKAHLKNGDLNNKKLNIRFFSKNPSQSKEDMDSLKNPITTNKVFTFLIDVNSIKRDTLIVKEEHKHHEVPKDCFKTIFSFDDGNDFELDVDVSFS